MNDKRSEDSLKQRTKAIKNRFYIRIFERNVGISIAVMAFLLAISTIWGNAVSDDLFIYRSLANDEWAYFQSKSIKEHVYESNLQLMDFILLHTSVNNSNRSEIDSLLDEVKHKQEVFTKEKKEIQSKAHEYEKLTTHFYKRSENLNIAAGLFQIAIVVMSVSIVAKNRHLWVLGILAGIAGIAMLYYVNFHIVL